MSVQIITKILAIALRAVAAGDTGMGTVYIS
jgi:hypothetical protein